MTTDHAHTLIGSLALALIAVGTAAAWGWGYGCWISGGILLAGVIYARTRND